ncbi:hypothetical protein MHTCC0001_35480 [Flavobacteriaceae bacterium MHTCC 0001]
MPMPNRDDGAGVNGYRYKYQGQEVDPETGKEAFELRLWDSRIGRWLTTDPAGQYSSPYLGVGNNPIRKVDPDGGKANDWFYDKDGNLQFDERVHSQADVDRLYGGGVLDAFSGGVYKSEYFHEGDYFYHSNGLVSNFKTGDVWQFNKIQVLDEIIIGASGRSNIEGYDFSLAVETLNSNCKNSSTGRCAKYVRFALEGGGLDLSNRPASTASAKGYKDYLPTLGFKGVSNDSYVPMAGDIVVIQSFTGNKVHKHGHIQMYNGSHWVSDFKQTGFWPGSDYRNNTPAYSIFR